MPRGFSPPPSFIILPLRVCNFVCGLLARAFRSVTVVRLEVSPVLLTKQKSAKMGEAEMEPGGAPSSAAMTRKGRHSWFMLFFSSISSYIPSFILTRTRGGMDAVWIWRNVHWKSQRGTWQYAPLPTPPQKFYSCNLQSQTCRTQKLDAPSLRSSFSLKAPVMSVAIPTGILMLLKHCARARKQMQ